MPLSPEQIGPYIESTHNLLAQGIQVYKARPDSGTQDAGGSATFLSFLSSAIGLEEEGTKQLLDVYRYDFLYTVFDNIIQALLWLFFFLRENEFRGSQEQLENMMKSHHLRPGLLAELWQFYHNERSYLLHCVEFLIQHTHHESGHRYAKIFQVNCPKLLKFCPYFKHLFYCY